MSSLHVFHSPTLLKQFPTIYGEILPSHNVGFWLAFVGTFGIILAILAEVIWGRLKASNTIWFLLLSTTAAGSFALNSCLTDEVGINLKHSLNLYSCGRFSFDCASQVDGTVELVYYALLAPFGYDVVALFRANYALGFALFAATIFSPVITGFYTLTSLRGRMTIAFLALAPQLAATYSSGFGNSAVVTGFAYSLIYFFSGRANRAFVIASLLPLLRPDALVLTMLLTVFGWLWNKKVSPGYLILTAISISLYYTTFYLLFDKFIPTPVTFKSAGLGGVSVVSILLAFHSFTKSYLFYTLLSVLFGGLVIYYKQRKILNEQQTYRVIAFAALIVGLVGLRCLYETAQSGVIFLNFRYWSPLDLSVLLLLTYLPWETVCLKKNKQALASICYLLLLGSALATHNLRYSHKWVHFMGTQFTVYPDHLRLPVLVSSGLFLDKYAPEDWSIATTEMASFALPIPERPITDLWGYTNPQIASSSYCVRTPFESALKIDPSYITKNNPDILWFRSRDNSFSIFPPDPQLVENSILEHTNAGTRYLQANTIEWQLENYNIFWVQDDADTVILFHVKDSLTQIFIDILAHNGLTELLTRPLDSERMKKVFHDNTRLNKIFVCQTGERLSYVELLNRVNHLDAITNR